MANPPSDYPRDWKDGGGAFGRLYGSTLATQTSKHTAEFLTEATFHYDARYSPSKSDGKLARAAHAVGYVFVEKTDAGKTAFALPHFAGAAAGGFTGMAYLPLGYDTLSKAGQRAGSELGQIALRNLAQEFAPELAPIARRIHLPKLLPVWWTPIHPVQELKRLASSRAFSASTVSAAVRQGKAHLCRYGRQPANLQTPRS